MATDEVAEIDEADKANLTDDANVNKAIATVDAKLDDLDEVNEANEIVEAAEADDSDKAIKSKEADDANEVNEAIAVDDAVVADEFDLIYEIGMANDSKMIGEVMLGLLTLFLPFSLTKHSTIFAEVKGFFEINNNQLGS